MLQMALKNVRMESVTDRDELVDSLVRVPNGNSFTSDLLTKPRLSKKNANVINC